MLVTADQRLACGNNNHDEFSRLFLTLKAYAIQEHAHLVDVEVKDAEWYVPHQLTLLMGIQADSIPIVTVESDEDLSEAFSSIATWIIRGAESESVLCHLDITKIKFEFQWVNERTLVIKYSGG